MSQCRDVTPFFHITKPLLNIHLYLTISVAIKERQKLTKQKSTHYDVICDI